MVEGRIGAFDAKSGGKIAYSGLSVPSGYARSWEAFMRSGFKFAALFIAGVLSISAVSATDTNRKVRKAPKKQLAPLPSGPRGPVPQIPLDSVPAVQPQVSYQNGQLSIVASNSTLGDILRAVRKQTAADMEIPANATERVATNLGPGPARDVVAELLNGSHFNYVLLGSPSDASQLTRVVLVAKTGSETTPPPPGNGPAEAVTSPPPAMVPVDVNGQPDQEPDAMEENADDTQEQPPAEAEQQNPPPEPPPGIKTPQQLLQEMQQRQLQMQQQQPGQTPPPGMGYPPPQVPRQP
jgi:hypothetical protein